MKKNKIIFLRRLTKTEKPKSLLLLVCDCFPSALLVYRLSNPLRRIRNILKKQGLVNAQPNAVMNLFLTQLRSKQTVPTVAKIPYESKIKITSK